MKTLILVRHAKSSWQEPGISDRLRPLNRRGQRDAPEMGRRLAERGVQIDMAVTSPATRAVLTARAVLPHLGYAWDDVSENELIYEASAATLMDVIRALDDRADTAMLFGHNPGLTDLVAQMRPRAIANVPTCGVVTLTFDIETWARIGTATLTTLDFDYPKKGD